LVRADPGAIARHGVGGVQVGRTGIEPVTV
jgi:hypothetical protein